jgi:hypothetical protein
LIGRSQSASYWLIGASGALWCLPARWIHAVGAGHHAFDQESFTLHYLDARHVAVPLSQFLLELFVGTWLGTEDPDTLEFARGQHPALRPAHIFEITTVYDG